jgi:DeoR/GlpR family transcriptional regulator of sugar metabolism
LFPHERRLKIQHILKEKGPTSVPDLSRLLSVAEVTIRRVLDVLDKQGIISKIYGGATLNEDEQEEPAATPSKADPLYEKRSQIASIAMHFIKDNSTLILGQGPLSLYISKLLHEKRNLTIISNDLDVMKELSSVTDTGRKLLLTGGEYISEKQELQGPVAIKAIADLHVDLSLIEIDGIDIDSGYYMESYEKVEISKQIFNSSTKSIAIIDSSKFSKRSFCHFDALDMFSVIITNEDAPDTIKAYCYSNNIKLYQSYDILEEYV